MNTTFQKMLLDHSVPREIFSKKNIVHIITIIALWLSSVFKNHICARNCVKCNYIIRLLLTYEIKLNDVFSFPSISNLLFVYVI